MCVLCVHLFNLCSCSVTLRACVLDSYYICSIFVCCVDNRFVSSVMLKLLTKGVVGFGSGSELQEVGESAVNCPLNAVTVEITHKVNNFKALYRKPVFTKTLEFFQALTVVKGGKSLSSLLSSCSPHSSGQGSLYVVSHMKHPIQ